MAADAPFRNSLTVRLYSRVSMLLSTTVFGDGYAWTDDTTSRAHLLRSLRPPRRYWLVLATAAIDPPPVSCEIGCWRMIMVIREMIYPLPPPRKMVMTAWLVGVVFDLRLVVAERELREVNLLTFTLYVCVSYAVISLARTKKNNTQIYK